MPIIGNFMRRTAARRGLFLCALLLLTACDKLATPTFGAANVVFQRGSNGLPFSAPQTRPLTAAEVTQLRNWLARYPGDWHGVSMSPGVLPDWCVVEFQPQSTLKSICRYGARVIIYMDNERRSRVFTPMEALPVLPPQAGA